MLCIEHQVMNKKIINNSYPTLKIDELIDEIYGMVSLSKINFHIGYH